MGRQRFAAAHGAAGVLVEQGDDGPGMGGVVEIGFDDFQQGVSCRDA